VNAFLVAAFPPLLEP
jgi:hypothetical protein